MLDAIDSGAAIAFSTWPNNKSMWSKMSYPSALRWAVFVSHLCAIMAAQPTAAQRAFPSDEARRAFLLDAPGASRDALYGYGNPALLNYVEALENTVAFSSARIGAPQLQWGLFSGARQMGFAAVRSTWNKRHVTDYRISLSGGDRRLGLGFSYGFSTGDARAFARKNHYVLGAFYRPSPRFSAGATVTATASGRDRELALDIGLRPLNSARLTLFAEGTRGRHMPSSWQLGARVTPAAGLHLVARYGDSGAFALGLELSMGSASSAVQWHTDAARQHAFNTYVFRLGGYEESVGRTFAADSERFVQIELDGPVRHRRFALFDEGHALLDLLSLIERVRRDPHIAGLAINASGLQIDRTMAWELREKLRQLQAAGKRVVIYIDSATLPLYYLVSVADYLIIDPVGMLVLEGYVQGNTYLKGALDKLGIGVDEWRLFEFKSAYEPFTRGDMSPGERAQAQALVDDFYALARSAIGQSRQIDGDTFDGLVNGETLFLPQEALANGLVDRVARWSEIDRIAKALGTPRSPLKADRYLQPSTPVWGQPPRVAVVYALGPCAMDSGIRARQLANDLRAVCEDAQIDAVVLRVDSPGGEVLAADLVADEVRSCRATKPIIASQSYVAASGGYWLSMNADAIVAAPNTVAGSIGVIGGWIYDAGIKETLGLSTDRVQVGRHADLPFGMTLPFVGALPDRTLNERERQRAEAVIRALYADFVARAAANRDMRPFELEQLARGRVWSGQRALEHGLIDALGGLDAAIELALQRAGLSAEHGIEVTEVPRLPPLNYALLRPRLIAAQPGQLGAYLQMRLRNNGRPLLLTPVELWPNTPMESYPHVY